MAETVALLPRFVGLQSDEFAAVCRWSFTDSYVKRCLTDDIPQRVVFGNGQILVYCDPNHEIVGFGSIDLCREYGNLTDNNYHTYVPLLAVHPEKQRRGYGAAIVNHLVGQASIYASGGGIDSSLFLDVYTDNVRAIQLYRKASFEIVSDPIFDETEGKEFFVMARRVTSDPS